jgi:hypothetical protein
MLDLIRKSQVPANLMQSAARGALSVPADETIEILVHLALHHKIFGERARLTLAGWDEKASIAAASDPNTSAEVLAYLVAPANLRPVLVPALASNPSVPEEALDELAVAGSRSVVESLLVSPRFAASARLLQALQTNSNLHPNELTQIATRLAALETSLAPDEAAREAEETDDEVVLSTVTKYLEENAAEIAAEKDKPFQPIGIALEESPEPAGPASLPSSPVSTHAVASPAAPATPAAHHKPKKPIVLMEEKRDSTLQKIGKLDIRGRITLAMRGNKEERSILIRDSTKLVALAVLDSPKVSDGEVEKFALQKNVLEAVLRAIPMKRKFAKNYNITRNLVQNPRTPLDLSLTLMKNLLVHDLKNLSSNKEVSDTIRKIALRMFKQKMEKKG